MRVAHARLGAGAFTVNTLGTRRLLKGWQAVKSQNLPRQSQFLVREVINAHRVPEFFQGLAGLNRTREFVNLFLALPDEEEESLLVTRTALANALDAVSLADFCSRLRAAQIIDYINALESPQAATFFRKVRPTAKGAAGLVDYVEKSAPGFKQYYRILLDRWGVVAPDEEKPIAPDLPDFKASPKNSRYLLSQWKQVRGQGIDKITAFCSQEIFGAHQAIDFFEVLVRQRRGDEFVRLFWRLQKEARNETISIGPADLIINALDPENLAGFLELLTPEQLLDYLTKAHRVLVEKIFQGVAPTEKGRQIINLFLAGAGDESERYRQILENWALGDAGICPL